MQVGACLEILTAKKRWTASDSSACLMKPSCCGPPRILRWREAGAYCVSVCMRYSAKAEEAEGLGTVAATSTLFCYFCKTTYATTVFFFFFSCNEIAIHSFNGKIQSRRTLCLCATSHFWGGATLTGRLSGRFGWGLAATCTKPAPMVLYLTR